MKNLTDIVNNKKKNKIKVIFDASWFLIEVAVFFIASIHIFGDWHKLEGFKTLEFATVTNYFIALMLNGYLLTKPKFKRVINELKESDILAFRKFKVQNFIIFVFVPVINIVMPIIYLRMTKRNRLKEFIRNYHQ